MKPLTDSSGHAAIFRLLNHWEQKAAYNILKCGLLLLNISPADVSKIETARAIITIPIKSENSHMAFLFAHLGLTLAHCKGKSHSHEHFDSEYV